MEGGVTQTRKLGVSQIRVTCATLSPRSDPASREGNRPGTVHGDRPSPALPDSSTLIFFGGLSQLSSSDISISSSRRMPMSCSL